MTELEKEAKAYFENPGFRRMFQTMADRFLSLDRIGGTVQISSLREEEKDVLEGFLQRDCHHKKNLSVSVETIRKALAKTKFQALSLEEIFALIYTEELYSKKQKKMLRQEQWEKTFEEVREPFQNTRAYDFILWQEIEETNVFAHMRQDEKKNQKEFVRNMKWVLTALNSLPVYEQKYVSLPVFAASVTGNPHAFDHGEKCEYYLLEGICWLLQLQVEHKTNAEEKMRIYDAAGILIDGISNFVTCVGVRGFDENGMEHPGMKGFYDCNEIMQLPLLLVSRCKQVALRSKEVYILENPAVFELVNEAFEGKKTVICGNGNLRMATIKLLDLCYQAGAQFYYSGDFDPEGLLIAQKLLDRYDDRVTLWHYELEDYQKAISHEAISDSRLAKCRRITDLRLLELVAYMEKTKKAGYQESLWYFNCF